MARSLPPLSPTQLVAVQDALLANADRLLDSSLVVLDAGDVALARSLAILGLEESGKAIALHTRRVAMAWRPEGEAFADATLRKLWNDHGAKLRTVHSFLVDEEYWFGARPSDPEANALALGAIDAWARDHNRFKQRGFYVDVNAAGEPVTPQEAADPVAVRAVVERVHQIGWQLRLGEHIEGKRRLEEERDIPAASDDEIEDMRRMLLQVDSDFADEMIESMREGRAGRKLNNADYAFLLPSSPFEMVGRPGYEAQDRELFALMEQHDSEGPVTDSSSLA